MSLPPSSLSTYLDVTAAASRGYLEEGERAKAEVHDAGRILAAIHQGTSRIADLPQATDLALARIFLLLASMSQSKLITIHLDGKGAASVALTRLTAASLNEKC